MAYRRRRIGRAPVGRLDGRATTLRHRNRARRWCVSSRSLQQIAKRLGVERAVRLLASANVDVPSVVGHFKPVILLPASLISGLTPDEIEAILAHELAHIRRHDYLINLIQTTFETLLFYHPAVWWISREIRRERENCCDDLAVQACGNRVAYARTLAMLEENRGPCQRPPWPPRAVRYWTASAAWSANRSHSTAPQHVVGRCAGDAVGHTVGVRDPANSHGDGRWRRVRVVQTA